MSLGSQVPPHTARLAKSTLMFKSVFINYFTLGPPVLTHGRERGASMHIKDPENPSEENKSSYRTYTVAGRSGERGTICTEV